MIVSPYLTIDLDIIEHNARTIVDLCAEHGIAVTGVTKCVCGHPQVAQAMLRGGVLSIADSRLENIHRLKTAGINTSYMLLRLPALSAVDDVVNSVDVSLNSELATLEALSIAAKNRKRVHDVIIMVDLGDLREGIWPNDVIPFVREALNLTGVHIKGLGTNLTCFAGVIPDQANMNQLVDLASEVEATFSINVDLISAVNSSGLELVDSGTTPRRINHARMGEAILLGRETTHRNAWPDTFQDAFVLNAEVLEIKRKPSIPIGECAEDAFGNRLKFSDQGNILRALVNVGREDVDVAGITPLDPRFSVLGASSGYLAVDVSAAEDQFQLGDNIMFSLNYSALLAAMTSSYVKKHLLKDGTVYDEKG